MTVEAAIRAFDDDVGAAAIFSFVVSNNLKCNCVAFIVPFRPPMFCCGADECSKKLEKQDEELLQVLPRIGFVIVFGGVIFS